MAVENSVVALSIGQRNTFFFLYKRVWFYFQTVENEGFSGLNTKYFNSITFPITFPHNVFCGSFIPSDCSVFGVYIFNFHESALVNSCQTVKQVDIVGYYPPSLSKRCLSVIVFIKPVSCLSLFQVFLDLKLKACEILCQRNYRPGNT